MENASRNSSTFFIELIYTKFGAPLVNFRKYSRTKFMPIEQTTLSPELSYKWTDG
jgi:hypothetical protein